MVLGRTRDTKTLEVSGIRGQIRRARRVVDNELREPLENRGRLHGFATGNGPFQSLFDNGIGGTLRRFASRSRDATSGSGRLMVIQVLIVERGSVGWVVSSLRDW
jgi:hypothetical protein